MSKLNFAINKGRQEIVPTFFDDEDYNEWEKSQLDQDHELDDDDDEDEHPREDDENDEWEEYEDIPDEESPFDVEKDDD